MNDMDKRLILIGLVVFATTAFAQPRARLLQLENYLQEQGLKKINTYKSNAKTAKIKHYWSGQLTAHTPKAVIDYIRTTFTDLSKEATESHMYENHKDGTDTIEYALSLSTTEAAVFTYKKNRIGTVSGVYKHTYETRQTASKDERSVADAIAARQWHIDITSMNTMRYGSKAVTSDFYLELRGDTLHSYLPYLGQARVSPSFSPSIGLNFEEPVLSYKESTPKSKKYTQIDIDVKTREDSYHYVIEVKDSGKATIRVRSLNRDPISFDGTMLIK